MEIPIDVICDNCHGYLDGEVRVQQGIVKIIVKLCEKCQESYADECVARAKFDITRETG